MNNINTINNNFVGMEPKPGRSMPAPSPLTMTSNFSEKQASLPVTESSEAENKTQNEQLTKAVESLQVNYGIKVELAPDDNGKIFVRIMSSDGERVLRQMPPDALIKMHASLKHNRGLLADWLV